MTQVPEPVVRAHDLSKIYQVGNSPVVALNRINLTIERGTFVAVVGTSGSGKSTLLNMLGGLEKPTAGEVWVAGQPLHSFSENQLVTFRRERVGFVFQSFNLISSMTAEENVAWPLSFQGVPKSERMLRARAALNRMGLAKHLRHKPTQMSGGQQQRVGIARALVVDPKIVFADEPTGNLDRKNAQNDIDWTFCLAFLGKAYSLHPYRANNKALTYGKSKQTINNSATECSQPLRSRPLSSCQCGKIRSRDRAR